MLGLSPNTQQEQKLPTVDLQYAMYFIATYADDANTSTPDISFSAAFVAPSFSTVSAIAHTLHNLSISLISPYLIRLFELEAGLRGANV
jgi:hypothetical protein